MQRMSGVAFANKWNDSLNFYALELSSVASFIQSSRDDISYDRFSRFVQDLSIHSDIGFYFAQYVTSIQVQQYESEMKDRLNNSFKVYPEIERTEYLPLTLGYPENIPYGYDILFKGKGREHIEPVKKAKWSLEFTRLTSASNNLGDEISIFNNTLVLNMPVYLPNEARANKLTDNSGFHGVVGAYFTADTLLKNMGVDNDDVLYRIAQVDKQGVPSWWMESASKPQWIDGAYDTQVMSFGGHEWRIDTRYPMSINFYINWSFILASIFLFTCIALFVFLYLDSFLKAFEKSEKALNKRVSTDELTGLVSRYQVQKILTKLISQHDQTNYPIVTFVLNLDHFKTINDAFGHEIGDKLLVKVGQRLHSVLPEEATIGYLSGDAFVVLLTTNYEYDALYFENIAKEIIHQISQSYFIDGRTLNIGCSIGAAQYPEFGRDAVTLIKNADMAVYKAKALGRATFHFYDCEMGVQFARNVRIESRLREALIHDEFELHFQPKVDITTEECVGVEVLLRWEDSELGVVSPAEFIPIAEQTGIILSLGEWVFEQAFKHIIEWQNEGICVPPIAINCSAAQLKRVDFLDNLVGLLEKYQIDPSLLEIEVTESILIEDAESCAELLRQISQLGIKLAIDDFGTGYSSLSYLKDLPFDYIKIDQVFVRDIKEDRNHAALTHAIIGLGHNLNLKVIAEGIENIDQLIMLQEFGCDIGQGYLFSKAVGANSMVTDPMILALSKKAYSGI